MSRYVLTQEQLDRLQDQIQKLTRLNEAKDERIKELEVHKVRVSSADIADLIKTIGKLEDEVKELRKINKRLTAESDMGRSNTTKIRELEMLLEEERKLREYSETFARQVELKCAEETLIKELTTELCQLQKDEIEIDSRRILDLQKKLRKFTNQGKPLETDQEKENKKMNNTDSNTLRHESNVKKAFKPQDVYLSETLEKARHFKDVIRKLQNQLAEIHKEIVKLPVKSKDEQERLKELENWLAEIGYVAKDVDSIENLQKDLNYLRNEIESKRKFVLT